MGASSETLDELERDEPDKDAITLIKLYPGAFWSKGISRSSDFVILIHFVFLSVCWFTIFA